jgi:hypothetical protein
MNSMQPTQDSWIYRIKVTLVGSKPPIWRRLLVPGDVTLGELHSILQVAMGWWDSHLHQFIVGDTFYGVPDADDFGYDDTRDEQEVTLQEIVPGEGFRFRYEYDFGDGWLHNLLVEKILEPDPDAFYPHCAKGRRACPPEDVGGIPGYEGFLEAIHDPKHPEHDDYLDWVGGEFDPEAFDCEEVNGALYGLFAGEEEGLAPIDRCVAVIKPRQPFVDWINSLVPAKDAVTLQQAAQDCTAYLMPDLDDMELIRDMLHVLKPAFFAVELEAWDPEADAWPAEPTAEEFDRWFDIEVHSMVYDLVAMLPHPKGG